MSERTPDRIETMLERDRWLIVEEWLGAVTRSSNDASGDERRIDALRRRMTLLFDALLGSLRQQADEGAAKLDAGSELVKRASVSSPPVMAQRRPIARATSSCSRMC